MTKTLSPYTESLLILLNHIAGQVEPAGEHFPGTFNQRLFTAEPGKGRDRVVWQSAVWSDRADEGRGPNWARAQRSVRCFVNREDGTIYYSGSWTSPAKWKGVLATEFSGHEHKAYAEFTRDKGWGYKGDRAAWEKRSVVDNSTETE